MNLVGKTGVYYRDLENAPIPLDGASLAPAGGTNRVVLIANNTDTFIPGTEHGASGPPPRPVPPTARCRLCRLRQRGNPDPRRHLPGAAGRSHARRSATLVAIGAPGSGGVEARHLQPSRRGRLLRRPLRGLLGRLGD
ncbi:MAG: hypothetical protein MZW92_78810 [Comamonadaceae bacterium]|nr:hypothetical protein [Comamonadaceae bacterium]